MPHAFGLRARTRHLFSAAYRKHGATPLSKLLTVFKKNDIVDVIGNGSVQRGMPHKFYHGKTGKVFDVTKNSLGVIINKRVNTRIVPKRIHVRIEHVRKSASREAFVERVKANDKLKREAKARGEKVNTKRIPKQPRGSQVVDVSKSSISYMNPIKFRELY
jgi:large subunit ribosomal protein L21e